MGGWGSQADFSQMGEIQLKFHQWLLSTTAEGWIPQGHPLPVWPCWGLGGFWKSVSFLAIAASLPGLGKPAETLTLQQAQNFQQSKSSSPRSRMRKMSSGMSQRKFPGGHSASDRHVTPRHQPRMGCAGREQGGRDTGERMDHSSLSDGAAQLTLAMPCNEKFPSHLCSHPAIPKDCAALYSNPRPWQQGKGSDL